MDYRIVVTSVAEESLDKFINYLIFEKKNFQAVCPSPEGLDPPIT